MNNAVKKKMSKSIYDFERIVKPKLAKSELVEGNIISIEKATLEKYKNLISSFDILAGIDAWIINTSKGIQGLASRIQWRTKNWETFTIRFKLPTGNETEYHKRLRAIETGEYLYPFYTVQAYIDIPRTGNLLGMAVAKTAHIFDMIKAGKCGERPNPEDGVRFKWVDWKEMQNYYPIEIFQNHKPKPTTKPLELF